ncbi:MAG: hypothetical protein HY904_24330 [Deltaproteobacteria bacterium]|nr:hypothetical protein [Deltaproteobacteria bacterium]
MSTPRVAALLLGLVALLGACEAIKNAIPEQVSPFRDAGRPAWRVEVPDPSVANWHGVWVGRHDLAYIVGDHGRIMRWDGVHWSQVSSPTTETLEAIWGRDETELWAVGLYGVILHGVDGVFTEVTQQGPDGGERLTTRSFFSVHGSGDRVYMVGERGEIATRDPPDGGVRLMAAETTLQRFPVCETRVNNIEEAVPVCTTQLVAHDTPDGGLVFGPDRYAGCGTPAECCPFATQGGFCCYPQRCEADGGPMFGRVGVDADLKSVWASGDYAVACGAGGSIFEFDATAAQWTRSELADNVPYTRDALSTAWGTGPGNVYCAGQDGRLMRKRSGAWEPTTIPTPAFVQGMWGTGGRDIYAVGFSGVVLRYDGYPMTDAGVGWFDEELPSGVVEHLRAVGGARLDYDGGLATPEAGPPPSRVIVVGAGGKVLIKN